MRNWSAMARSFSRRRVGKRNRPKKPSFLRKERLMTSALPARVSRPVVR